MRDEADAASTGLLAKDKLEFLDQVYNRLNQFSVHADTKAAIILSFHGVWVFSIVPALAGLFIDLSSASPAKVIFWIASVVALLFFALSFALSSYNAFMVLLPRVTPRKSSETRPPSLIFFGEIAALNDESIEERARAYHDSLSRADDETLAQDYIHRICDVSEVVRVKFECVSRSIRHSIRTFALWACTLVLLVVLGDMV